MYSGLSALFGRKFWSKLNPFKKRRKTPRDKPLWLGFGLGMVLAVALIGWGWWHLTSERDFLDSFKFSGFETGTIFQATSVFPSQASARSAYREGLDLLHDQAWATAAQRFQDLSLAYPALRPWIRLHQAEAAQHLPREDQVQSALLDALDHAPDHALSPQIRYRLAQSYLRSGNTEAALESFLILHQRFPKSDYGQGALYYLRDLQQNEALGWQYLAQVPSGRFSAELAEAYRLQKQPKSSTQRTVLARSLGDQAFNAPADEQLSRCKTALPLLKQASGSQIWPWLGFCQSLSGSDLSAGAIWQQALSHPAYWTLLRDWPDASQERLFRLIASNINLQASLNSAEKRKLPQGVGDRLLWHLGQSQSGALRRQTLTTLIQQYPQSRYAAESVWETQFRPAILARNFSKLPPMAESFLKRYPNVNRSPDVRLWHAHALRLTGHLAAANTVYQEILTRHPLSYAAYRADRWQVALSSGLPHADWEIPAPPASPASPVSKNQPTLQTLLQARSLSDFVGLQTLKASEKVALNELHAIQAWPDIARWANDVPNSQISLRQKTLLLALAALGQENTVSGLHALRDQWLSPGPSHVLLSRQKARYQLLYPWLGLESTLIHQATENHLPPVLALSLLREESYFNPRALSLSGARGLMQLMPATAQEVAHSEGFSGFTIDDLYRPDLNIQLGCRYLGDLLKRMQGHPMLAVASYNAGPGAVTRWLQTLKPSGERTDADWFAEALPAQETRDYVRKVFGSAWAYHVLYDEPQTR